MRAFRSTPESILSRKEHEIQDTISRRAHELFASSGFTHGHDLQDWLSAESELYQAIPLTFSQTEKSVTVKAELPGFTEHDIEVTIEPCRLAISGQRDQKSEEERKGSVVSSERRSLHAFRILDLPAEVDPDKVRATFSNGELEVTLIKKHIGHIHIIQEMVA
jgi:HSP20 family protein